MLDFRNEDGHPANALHAEEAAIWLLESGIELLMSRSFLPKEL